MANVVGIIFSIVGFIVTLFTTFLYLNSSAALPYNPADDAVRASDVGLVLPMILGVTLLVAGIIFLTQAKEANPDMKE